MKKTYWRVRHTQLGANGGQFKFFRTEEEAEKFAYKHLAAGGGANNPRKVNAHKNLTIALPNGMSLGAELTDNEEYPGISISLNDSEVLCFVEYNPTKPQGKEICICAYAEGMDEPCYYESYSNPQNPSPNN